MSAEQNKALMRQFFAALDTGDLEGMVAQVTEDMVTHTPIPGIGRGREGFRGFMSVFFSAFPEQSVQVHRVIAEGDRVAVHHTHHATHGGDFLGLPPTGKRVTVTGIEIFRIENGKIAEMWHQDDLLSLMQQLGIVPGPEQRT